jgi:membrane associated rhomboid family serine protease
MFPIRTDYQMHIRPWVNYALVAINVLVFMAQIHGGNPTVSHLLLQPAAPNLLQFFTSMFMHANAEHLIGNMVFLWVFGNALNDRLGHAGYLLFYLAGGVMAGLGYLAVSGSAPVLGASGAISAVTGAYMVLFPRVQVTMLFWFIIITTFQVSSLVFLAIQFVWNLWMSAQVVLAPGVSAGVAYVAHSSGYVFGILVAALLLWTRIIPPDAFDLLNLFKAWKRRSHYRRMVSQGYEPFAQSATAKGASRQVKAKVTVAPQDNSQNNEAQRLRRELSTAMRRGDFDAAANLYQELTALDPQVALPRQQQLDVANHLMGTQNYAASAEAYERFLAHYPNYRYVADIHLMLGLLYSRYLHRCDSAEAMLQRAIDGLSDPVKRQMAETELAACRKRKS